MNIYKITNKLNNKIYIGQEKKYDPCYYGSGILIKEEINKLGKNNFMKEIIEFCDSIQSLNDREIYWIRELNSRDPSVGYNIAPGGSLFCMNDEISKKISISLKGKYTGEKSSRFGKKISEDLRLKLKNNSGYKNWTEESRRKASESKKGIKFSEESRKKMSDSKKGKLLDTQHKNKISDSLRGRELKEETREKIKKSNIDKKQKNTRMVFVTNIGNKELLIFNNILSACRFFYSTVYRIKMNKIPGYEIMIE